MSPVALKGIGFGCFVLSAALLFVGWERYNSNVKAVEALNRITESPMFGGISPLTEVMKQVTGGKKAEAEVPAATVVALILAAMSAIGGATCLAMTKHKATKAAFPTSLNASS